ncbi:MAG TPA: hypothetical protein ENH82_18065 [bacterium]|nr:hypothetical protein [bacterium]
MATDDGMIPDDEGEVEYFHRLEFGIQCNRCGREGFYWGYYRGKSRLFDEIEELHTCGKDSGL